MNARRRLTRLLLGVLSIAVLTTGPAPADDYAAGSTFVARGGSNTVIDIGMVACDTTGSPSMGGACIPWSAGDAAIKVEDDTNGTDVAFQVCVDNDGDGFCGGAPTVAGCDDTIVFSHFDDGSFSNPLAAPTSFTSGCPGGFPGWVVFLCEGVHAEGTPHSHEVTTGTVTSVASGGPSGTFCGAPLGKPYVHTRVPNGCFGLGNMTTSAPLGVSGLSSSTSASFAITFTTGACQSGVSTFSMSGTLTGFCFNATGSGQVSSGHRFNLTWAGPSLELTPVGLRGAAGSFSVAPNTLAGQSCNTGASQFVVGGAFALP